MEEKRESLNKAKKDLEDLEDSGASQREIDNAKAKIRTLEAEHQKARKNYFSSVQAEAEEIQVNEEIEEEEVEEVQVVDYMETIKAINKQNNALESRILLDIHISENLKESDERRKEAKCRIERNKAFSEKNQEEKKELLERFGTKTAVLRKEMEQLPKKYKDLEKMIESDKKIAADRNSEPYEVEAAEKRVELHEREKKWVRSRLNATERDLGLEDDRPLL